MPRSRRVCRRGHGGRGERRWKIDFEDDVGQRVAAYLDVQASRTIPGRVEVDRFVGLQNELPAALGIALHDVYRSARDDPRTPGPPDLMDKDDQPTRRVLVRKARRLPQQVGSLRARLPALHPAVVALVLLVRHVDLPASAVGAKAGRGSTWPRISSRRLGGVGHAENVSPGACPRTGESEPNPRCLDDESNDSSRPEISRPEPPCCRSPTVVE